MKEVDEWRQIGVADVILALRHGHTCFPYREDGADGE